MDDGAMALCGPPRRLCDDFEGGALNARWQASAGLSIDSSRAHRGVSSLHAHTGALAVGDGDDSLIWESTLLPLGDPMLYVRVWIQLDEMPANNMALIGAVQTVGIQEQIGVFIVPTGMTVYSQFEERSRETPGPPPLSQWLCLQWTITRSLTDGSLVLAGDAGGAMLSNVQTEGNAGLVDFQIGIAFADSSVDDPQPPMDVWLDDLVVSTAPVTCAE